MRSKRQMLEDYQSACIDGLAGPEEWDDTTRAMISWLEQTMLPETFNLDSWSQVRDGRKYREYMLKALEAGPESGSARAMAYHRRTLYERFGNTSVQS